MKCLFSLMTAVIVTSMVTPSDAEESTGADGIKASIRYAQEGCGIWPAFEPNQVGGSLGALVYTFTNTTDKPTLYISYKIQVRSPVNSTLGFNDPLISGIDRIIDPHDTYTFCSSIPNTDNYVGSVTDRVWAIRVESAYYGSVSMW